MSRPVTTLAVGFVFMQLFAVALQAQGVTALLGVGTITQPCPDNPTADEVERIADCKVSDITSDDNVESGTATGSTLFGMYNVLTGQLSKIYDVLYPGLNLLEHAGIPSWITEGIIGNLFSLMIFISLMSFLRGWDL